MFFSCYPGLNYNNNQGAAANNNSPGQISLVQQNGKATQSDHAVSHAIKQQNRGCNLNLYKEPGLYSPGDA